MRFHAVFLALTLVVTATLLGSIVPHDYEPAQAADRKDTPANRTADARLQLMQAFQVLVDDRQQGAMTSPSRPGLQPLDAQQEAHVLHAIAEVERYSHDPATRRAAVAKILGNGSGLLNDARLVSVSVEHAMVGMYVTLLGSSPRGDGGDGRLAIWAVKHVAATGDRADFDRVLALALRVVTESAAADGEALQATPARFHAASNLILIAEVAWTCRWDKEGETAAFQAGRLVEGTPLQLLIQAQLAQTRLETDVPNVGTELDALSAALPQTPADLLETNGTDLPTLEGTLRLVASLALRRGYSDQANRLWTGLHGIAWKTPADAPAAAAAVRLGHDASLAACGIGIMPPVDGGATPSADDPGDATISAMARAAAYRSQAIGLLRAGDPRAALAPLDSALALAREVGWRSLESDDPRKSSHVAIENDVYDLDERLVGLEQLMRLRFFTAAMAGDPGSIQFGIEWLDSLYKSDRKNAAFHAAQFLGTVADFEAADRLIDVMLPLLDGIPFPNQAELDKGSQAKERLKQHPDFAFLRADLLLRHGRVADAIGSLAYVPVSTSYWFTDQARRWQTTAALSASLNLTWKEPYPHNGVPPEILAVLSPNLSIFPEYGSQAGADDAVALLGRLLKEISAVTVEQEARAHVEQLFFYLTQDVLHDPLDSAIGQNVALQSNASRELADTMFKIRNMSNMANFQGATLLHDAAAGEARYSPIVDAYKYPDGIRLLDPPCPATQAARRVPATVALSGFALRRRKDPIDELQSEVSSAELAADKNFPQTIGGFPHEVDQIVSSLQAGQVVILASRAGPDLAVTTVTQAGMSIRFPVRFSAAEDDIRQVRASLTQGANGALPPFANEAAGRISRALLSGLPEGRQRIYLLLDDALRDLPENVLLTSDWDSGLKIAKQRWLDQRATTQRVFGLDNIGLQFSKEAKAAPKPPMTVAVGAPVLSPGKTCNSPPASSPERPDMDEVASRVSRLCTLERAADMLVLLTPSGGPAARRLIGPDATLGKLRALAASGGLAEATALIFATHGLDAAEAERLSGVGEPALVLTPSLADHDDGLLRAQEIATMRILVDLVVLIACNSGTRSGSDAISYRGLVDAFLTAGARSLMTAGWPADEQATARLLTYFSRSRIHEKLTPEEALGQAMQQLRLSESRYQHPFYWAPFSYVGTTSSIQ